METAGVRPAELLYSSTEPLLLEGVSPDGRILARADHAVQPWAHAGKSGPFVCLALSPDGGQMVLMAQSPGIALIRTDALDPAGRPSWAPGQSIVERTGHAVVTLQH